MRADFQQYYGLDLDGMGRDYTTLHAADLLMQLPEGARTRVAYDPASAWTTDRTLVACAVNALNLIWWSKTKDGQRGRNRPRPVGPAERGGARKKQAMAMSVGELDEILSRPRGGEIGKH